MKKIISLIAALAFSGAALAYSPAIHSVKVDVALSSDGAAHIREWWDVTVASGTEWYLVRSNLGDMSVLDFSVEENGVRYLNEGEWDTERDIDAKKGRCGILQRNDGGVELCWGVGSMGPHSFSVSYTMTGAVVSLRDYDALHLQLVSPGLSSSPEDVEVAVRVENQTMTPEKVRFWGFGFEGSGALEDGTVVFRSDGDFGRNSSVIALVRFDKGWFGNLAEDDRPFQEVLDRAMEGADFGDEEEDDRMSAIFAILMTVLAFLSVVFARSAVKRGVLGCRPKDVQWHREPPYGGNLAKTGYTLRQLGEMNGGNMMPAALILRMIYSGQLVLNRDADDNVEIAFAPEPSFDGLPPEAAELFYMMKDAGGEDMILQSREFSRWSRRHQDRIRSWVSGYENAAGAALKSEGDIKSFGGYTKEGQQRAREALGFKKFLSDFTSMDVKSSLEVHLWQEYLVFAALFGIADRVAEELRDIDTEAYGQTVFVDYMTMRNLIRMTDSLSRSITRASVQSGYSGTGGSTSFGGGGGFHGGGFGGGSR